MPTLVVGMWRINPRFHHAHDSLGMALVFPQQKLFRLKVPPKHLRLKASCGGEDGTVAAAEITILALRVFYFTV